jgi:eukaryotic-like serine/threonine-protein kinase
LAVSRNDKERTVMTPETWEAIQDKLHAALKMKSQERAAFLAEVNADDPEVGRELESLIAAHERADHEFPQAADALASLSQAFESRLAGKRLGNYQILEQLGTGGMGEVYRAVRADDQYQKQVAIKLVRAGLDSGFVIGRFKNERQILANLDHLNIARLLDGGTTEEGVPYFVMELIEGEPIDQYCDKRRLATTERLQLFSQVCSAVQYAHQRLIVHRDIKPGNILVTAEGTPKLLDFGIAKIVDVESGRDDYQPTMTAFRALTPAYASPEQVKGEPITTASDVYSLGVVLYELLTGHTPYRGSKLTPQEMTHAVCETEPEKPSTVVTRTEAGDGDPSQPAITPASVSAVRDGSPEKLKRRLDGDLDNIVLMALRKEPQRRYASVEQFREDIRRHLEHLPVIARKDTVVYRTTKFIARHKAGVAAGVIVALALLGGMGATLREAHIARAERARAERRFNDVRNLSNTLLFKIDDSIKDLPGSTEAQHLLISSAQQYLDGLSQEAGGDLGLLRELATGYERLGQVQGGLGVPNLGDSGSAIESYRKAVNLREAIAKANSAEPQAQHELQISYDTLGRAFLDVDLNQSADYLQKSMNIATSLVNKNPSNADFLEALVHCNERQAMLLTRRNDTSAALQNQEQALKLAQRLVDMAPSESNRTLLSYQHKRVGALLINSNKLPQALAEYQASQALDEALLSAHPTDPKRRFAITYTYSDIGFIYWKQHEFAAALTNYRKVLDIRQALAEADPHDARARLGVAKTCGYIGDVLRDQKRFKAALPYNLRELTIRASQASANPTNTTDRIDLAEVWWDLGTDYMGIAETAKATNDKLRLLRLARNYLQQSLPVYVEAKAKGLLYGSEVNAPQEISQDLAKCTKALKVVEDAGKR